MQSKISSFFKPFSSSSTKSDEPTSPICKDGDCDAELALWENTQHQFRNTYKRRASKLDKREERAEAIEGQASDALPKSISKYQHLKPELISSGKVLNKKRSYAQFHLDLGQSDFNLRTCNICGVKYSPGEEGDEKEHRKFHKNYTQGVHFKGCLSQRVFPAVTIEGGRIVLVLDRDPISQRNKVQEVIKMMEIELGGGWILHKLCKVYLFISSQRVAGCLVAEPIKEAFRVIPSSVDRRSDTISKTKPKTNSTTLRFGEIILHREVMKKVSAVKTLEMLDGNHNGAIVCEEEAAAAVCGIRAIWVTPSNRRTHIATQLLDTARRSFCTGFNLEISQLAFSPPTSAGKALASSYTGTASFMVYKPQAMDS
ncbi:protein CHROMOSOME TRANSMISSION FIDELITY 7-like [Euphorbia lathyris]|uniref:protein CHROMOSOME TRANSMISSION FIDELITY 7-like n=1 Tax=Euphorbia lathyris TaxID=212925 RepID=UPI003313EE92